MKMGWQEVSSVCTSNKMKSKGKKTLQLAPFNAFTSSLLLSAFALMQHREHRKFHRTSCYCLVTESQAGAPTRTDNYTHNVITINREFCSCLSVEIQCVMALIRVLRLSVSACVCLYVCGLGVRLCGKGEGGLC